MYFSAPPLTCAPVVAHVYKPSMALLGSGRRLRPGSESSFRQQRLRTSMEHNTRAQRPPVVHPAAAQRAASAAGMYPMGGLAPQTLAVATGVAPPATTVGGAAQAAMDYGLGKGDGGGYGRLPGVSAALGTGVALTGRGNGLDYAVMRKEKAREEYKEQRRLELLANGDVERTKRRKKNDTSMTENQKYHRRLKMNQDSAAAARHAQEVYINTLENLVEVTESEKSVLSIQAVNLKTERDELMRRVHQLQQQLETAGDMGGEAGSKPPGANQAAIDLKTVFELIDSSAHGAPTDFRNMNSAVQPPRAV